MSDLIKLDDTNQDFMSNFVKLDDKNRELYLCKTEFYKNNYDNHFWVEQISSKYVKIWNFIPTSPLRELAESAFDTSFNFVKEQFFGETLEINSYIKIETFKNSNFLCTQLCALVDRKSFVAFSSISKCNRVTYTPYLTQDCLKDRITDDIFTTLCSFLNVTSLEILRLTSKSINTRVTNYLENKIDEDKAKPNKFLAKLPFDICTIVMSFLEFPDICNLLTTNSFLNLHMNKFVHNSVKNPMFNVLVNNFKMPFPKILYFEKDCITNTKISITQIDSGKTFVRYFSTWFVVDKSKTNQNRLRSIGSNSNFRVRDDYSEEDSFEFDDNYYDNRNEHKSIMHNKHFDAFETDDFYDYTYDDSSENFECDFENQ